MARRRVGTLLKVLAAVGALVVIAGGVLVFLFAQTALASNRARTDSIALLQSVRTHGNDAVAAMRAVPPFTDISSTNPDFARAKQTADQYNGQLGTFQATVRADEVRLRTDRDRLTRQATGVLALPFRASLEHERLRAESLLAALQAEDTGMQIEQDEMKAVSATFDAEGDFTTLIVGHLDKQDITGSIALFPALDGKLATAAKASAGHDQPPQLQKLIADMQTLSTDLDAFLQAAQRGDSRRAQALEPKVEADATAAEAFDSQGFTSYEQTLLQPYIDRFDSGVRAAGFTPQTVGQTLT
jgi:hypothetical protein